MENNAPDFVRDHSGAVFAIDRHTGRFPDEKIITALMEGAGQSVKEKRGGVEKIHIESKSLGSFRKR